MKTKVGNRNKEAIKQYSKPNIIIRNYTGTYNEIWPRKLKKRVQ